MAENNSFLVSVADAILRDPTTGNALAFGKANINSTFTLTTAQTDVRGGINNPLLYTYIHDRTLEVKVEQATFDKVILGLNVGQLVGTDTVEVTQTDCLTTSASSCAQITLTPVGDVTVFLANGDIQTVTPSTKDIALTGAVSQVVTAVYITSLSADQITIETITPPSVVDLTLLAEQRDNTGVITEYLQINVPRFQVLGNYTLNMTANGVSTQALDGKALAVASSDCTSGEYYAKVTWVPVAAASTIYSSIAALPARITFSGSPATSQITVLGIRGGIYQNTNITSLCTFAASGSAKGSLDVGAGTGLVTTGSQVSSGSVALVTCTYAAGSLVDYVQVYNT
jgi:hypothetical protein